MKRSILYRPGRLAVRGQEGEPAYSQFKVREPPHFDDREREPDELTPSAAAVDDE